jgi:hypothetical protein
MEVQGETNGLDALREKSGMAEIAEANRRGRGRGRGEELGRLRVAREKKVDVLQDERDVFCRKRCGKRWPCFGHCTYGGGRLRWDC